MNYSIHMQMSNSRNHLLHDFSSAVFVKFLLRNNAIEKLATLAVLHNDVHVSMVNVTFEKLYDVGVVYLLKN